jgi:hypothetical protein
MCSAGKRFVLGFTVGAFATCFLNIIPFLLTHGAYNADGFEVVGFPFTFRRLGGFAGIDEFRISALLDDIFLGVVVALIIGYACAERGSKRENA